jgi:hypothetical protein
MHSSTLYVEHDSMSLDISAKRTSAKFDEFLNNKREDISSFLTRMSLLKDVDSISISLQPRQDSQPQELLLFLEKEVIDKILTTIMQKDSIKFEFVIIGIKNDFIKILQQKSLNIVRLNMAYCAVDGATIKHLVAFLKNNTAARLFLST